jgi:superfamily I DNA/RNA helicase
VQSARGKSLYSVRIDQAYRAIVFHPGAQVFVLTWVDHHDDAYEWARTKVFTVHPLTGALQVVNAESVQPVENARPAIVSKPAGIFAAVKDKHLLRFGVPGALLPLVRELADEEDLEEARSQLPQEAYEALFLLVAGYTVEEVYRETEKEPEGPTHDPNDFKGALENEDSKRRFFVVEEAKDLAELLNAPLEQWRVFLHPKQRKLVTRHANGPVRVLGGAGTGKTVVAMHRARHLAGQLFAGKGDHILFTTFTRNLATDIYENLRKLCSAEELARIEVINLDAWVSNFLRAQGYRHKVLFGEDENECWQNALNVAPSAPALSPAFYRSEWERIVQAQNVTTADGYLMASRVGRGTKLTRAAKKSIWPVFQEYRAQLNEHDAKEYTDLIRDARQLIETRKLSLPYRAVVLDEAQDMSAEAFRLLRAIVPEGANDLFIVGDAHQRIYRYRVTLSQCGINIRGRSQKLRINYRTTDEIRRFAVALLEGRQIDDLDGGVDDQKGYMSLTHGLRPCVSVFATPAEELRHVEQEVRRLIAEGAAPASICVVARTNGIMEGYEAALKQAGVELYRIKRDGADQAKHHGVRLATMHRVKGLEFEHILVVSANADVIPLGKAVNADDDPVSARDAETGERALLYVALTRAKKSASISAFGVPSPFVPAP